jgi:hypothetical protein
VIGEVVWEYLECGDLKNGFARVPCKDCSEEYLLAFKKFHPHIHAIVSDGLFRQTGTFYVMPEVDLDPFEEIFRAETHPTGNLHLRVTIVYEPFDEQALTILSIS